ncbi:MAG: hypothetical protein H6581_04180 [Bacteroidia bacterium]|nr:hypothetical protein [Bacteroidia bacterium]
MSDSSKTINRTPEAIAPAAIDKLHGKQISVTQIKPDTPYYLMRQRNNDYLSAANKGVGNAQNAYYGRTHEVDVMKIYFSANPVEEDAKMYILVDDNKKYLKPYNNSLDWSWCEFAVEDHNPEVKPLQLRAFEMGEGSFVFRHRNLNEPMFIKSRHSWGWDYVTIANGADGAVMFTVHEA